jgi:hypothetical protein
MPGTSASTNAARSGTAAIAVVTAALLLAGCASKNSAAGSGGKPPKLLIGTGTSAGEAAPMMAAAGVAPGDTAASTPAIGRYAGFGGYVLSGTLPTQPTHAPIWAWQSGKASESDVTKLASALGLTGTPQRHAYGWDLTSSAGELRVRDSDGEQWSYNRADTVPCPAYQTDIDNADGASVGFGCAVAPTEPGTVNTVVQGPDETTTKAAAANLLSKLGVTGSDQFYASSPTSTLTVAPQIDGMPTQGIETNVDVDAKGIRAATGRLVDPKAGDDYPLQTAAAAFKSLADRPMPMIAMYCGPLPVDGGPIPAASGPNTKFPLNPSPSDLPAPVASGPNTKFPLNPAASASPNTVLVASPPPAPVSGPAIDSAGPASPPDATAPVESSYPCPTPAPQKVTGAVIGLQVQYNASGATTSADGSTSGGTNILVPTWFFTVEGSTDSLTAIAVDPSFLGDQFPIPPVGPASAGATSGGFSGSGGGSAIAVPPAPPSAVVGPALPPAPATKS